MGLGIIFNFAIYFLIFCLDWLPDRFILGFINFSGRIDPNYINRIEDIEKAKYPHEKTIYYCISIASFGAILDVVLSIAYIINNSGKNHRKNNHSRHEFFQWHIISLFLKHKFIPPCDATLGDFYSYHEVNESRPATNTTSKTSIAPLLSVSALGLKPVSLPKSCLSSSALSLTAKILMPARSQTG